MFNTYKLYNTNAYTLFSTKTYNEMTTACQQLKSIHWNRTTICLFDRWICMLWLSCSSRQQTVRFSTGRAAADRSPQLVHIESKQILHSLLTFSFEKNCSGKINLQQFVSLISHFPSGFSVFKTNNSWNIRYSELQEQKLRLSAHLHSCSWNVDTTGWSATSITY